MMNGRGKMHFKRITRVKLKKKMFAKLRESIQRCCGKKEVHEIKYEWMYPLDTGYLFETPENIAQKLVEDTTPEGIVRMRFIDGIFEYWADRAQNYRFLETVARKYVIVYDCRDQYINIFRELIKAREVIEPPIVTSSIYLKRGGPPPRSYLVNAAANRYKWLGKRVETIAPKGLSYSDFKKRV